MIEANAREWLERSIGPTAPRVVSGNLVLNCPYHQDTRPSLHVRFDKGRFGVFICRACGEKGDIVHLVRHVESCSFRTAVEILGGKLDGTARPRRLAPKQDPIIDRLVDADLIWKWQERMGGSHKAMRFLTETRGLDIDIVREFVLGWDGSRITFPVMDETKDGTWKCVNVRRYLPNAPTGVPKMISYGKGYGSNRLYPKTALVDGLRPPDTVVLCEGEIDCLTLLQAGVVALTPTAGSASWRDDWTPQFRGRSVVIMYDADDAGRKGAARVSAKIKHVARSVKRVILQDGWDVNDLWLRDRERFHRIAERLRRM